MATSFLDQLPLPDKERAKLAGLGATGPAALLGMMAAAPESFDRLLGKACAQELRRALNDLVTESERALLATPPPPVRARGAIVDRPAPPIAPPRYDVAERDRLFAELQALRRQENPAPATRERIADLEGRLTAMLETRSERRRLDRPCG
jgi:hypothetical protein